MQAPKRKTSKSKRNMRRSHHALVSKRSAKCKECGGPVLPHHVCPACGNWRKRNFGKAAAAE